MWEWDALRCKVTLVIFMMNKLVEGLGFSASTAIAKEETEAEKPLDWDALGLVL